MSYYEGRVSELEMAWLAGLLEGEGSFIKAPPSEPNRPRISLQMTDEDVIKKVSKIYGVLYLRSKRTMKANWKSCYQVVLRGKKAIELMELLYPLMGRRRKMRIEEVIKSYVPRPADVAKLNNKAVRDIRSRRVSMRKFAELYCVAKGTIQRVQEKKYYKGVT